jgi:hypothetical protein
MMANMDPRGLGVSEQRSQRTLYVLAGLIAAAGIGAAAVIYFTGGPSPGPAASDNGAVQNSTKSGKTTCEGWTTFKTSSQAMTQLPDGWTYQTPYIDIQINARAAQLDTLLKLLAEKVQPEPAALAATARTFIDIQSNEGPKLKARTFGPSDMAAINRASQALDEACGIS